ncbi:MAG: CBS domain-containing protein [Acidobacteriota bacterium]|nr:CBS domain-containing protein [Acidobacteriota bacterium]MDH3783981.1 CBS domain-containing protein [Acidobacteriota bacterium]
MPKTPTIEKMMARDVAVVRCDEDVHELEKRMIRERVHGLPVVDEDGTVIGVVSQTDLIAWHYNCGVDGASFYDQRILMPTGTDGRNLRLTDIRSATVDEIMSPIVYCIRPDQTPAAAAALMINRQVHRLIVVDEEARVLGILSAADLLHAIPGIEGPLRELEVEHGTRPAEVT